MISRHLPLGATRSRRANPPRAESVGGPRRPPRAPSHLTQRNAGSPAWPASGRPMPNRRRRTPGPARRHAPPCRGGAGCDQGRPGPPGLPRLRRRRGSRPGDVDRPAVRVRRPATCPETKRQLNAEVLSAAIDRSSSAAIGVDRSHAPNREARDVQLAKDLGAISCTESACTSRAPECALPSKPQ